MWFQWSVFAFIVFLSFINIEGAHFKELTSYCKTQVRPSMQHCTLGSKRKLFLCPTASFSTWPALVIQQPIISFGTEFLKSLGRAHCRLRSSWNLSKTLLQPLAQERTRVPTEISSLKLGLWPLFHEELMLFCCSLDMIWSPAIRF